MKLTPKELSALWTMLERADIEIGELETLADCNEAEETNAHLREQQTIATEALNRVGRLEGKQSPPENP